MSAPIRLLIVDDHAIVRKGLAMVLRLEPDFEVVGEAANGRDGLKAAQYLRPHVALIDLIMPEMDGQAMAVALRKANPDIKIIILTGTTADDRLFDLLAMGVEGYVLKNIEPAGLVEAIHAVVRGEAYLHPEVLKKVLARVHDQPKSPPPVLLTPREREILEWMATPYTYRQIAARLHISEETVRSHAKNIMGKLKQPNRTQTVLAAIQAGLIELR
jgi:DNA-binding NarL/FixJ family response regulator